MKTKAFEQIKKSTPFVFKRYELPEDEKGIALYWLWNDFGKTEEICKSLGASGLTKSQKGAISRIAMHAHYEALGAGRPIHYSRSKTANFQTSPVVTEPYNSFVSSLSSYLSKAINSTAS